MWSDHIHYAIQELHPGALFGLDYVFEAGPANEPILRTWDADKLGPFNMPVLKAKCLEIAARKIVPAEVTSAQAVVALQRRGLLSQVETVIADYPADVQIWYHRARTWQRNNPYVLGIAIELGLSDDEVDDLFIYAKTLLS